MAVCMAGLQQATTLDDLLLREYRWVKGEEGEAGRPGKKGKGIISNAMTGEGSGNNPQRRGSPEPTEPIRLVISC